MKIIVFTSNALRHKYFSNTIGKTFPETLIISECRENDQINNSYGNNELIKSHFNLRYQTESEKFVGNDEFKNPCIPILYKEVNNDFIFKKIKSFNPDVMIVFGSSIIREPLLSLGKKNKFLNLHLGLSPYYKGNGTNFWPFINNELEMLGSTILHIDSGIDTGDIVTHVRPKIIENDNVHTVGCKIIEESTKKMIEILKLIEKDISINRVPQWKPEIEKIYKLKDFNEEILRKYFTNIEKGIVHDYIISKKRNIQIVDTISQFR